jgi:hypothetical protein
LIDRVTATAPDPPMPAPGTPTAGLGPDGGLVLLEAGAVAPEDAPPDVEPDAGAAADAASVAPPQAVRLDASDRISNGAIQRMPQTHVPRMFDALLVVCKSGAASEVRASITQCPLVARNVSGATDNTVIQTGTGVNRITKDVASNVDCRMDGDRAARAMAYPTSGSARPQYVSPGGSGGAFN